MTWLRRLLCRLGLHRWESWHYAVSRRWRTCRCCQRAEHWAHQGSVYVWRRTGTWAAASAPLYGRRPPR